MSDPLRRYELEERIAAGGMGEVFRARVSGAHGFAKVVAVKRILPELARDPELLLRFVGEAKLAVALNHANIVQVFDLCRTDDELIIVMELVDGVDLTVLLQAMAARKQRTPLGIALHIATEAAKALAYAHEAAHAVIHCDISPANLLVSWSGEVKVTDFGVAQSLTRARKAAGASHVMGKLRYMAPEQLRGDHVDERTDLYAVGVVLWELLAMRPLFRVKDAQGRVDEEAITRAMLLEPPPPLESLRPDLSPALCTLVTELLTKAPAARPPSAAVLLQRLAKITHESGPSLTAPEIGAWARALCGKEKATTARPRTRSARVEPGERLPTLTFHGKLTDDGLLVLSKDVPPPRRRRYVAASALGVILALVALGVRSRAHSRATTVAELAHATAPTQSAASPPITTPPIPPIAPPVLATHVASIVARPHHEPAHARVEPGFLNVYAEPWAAVAVDGHAVGTTPLVGLRLPAGEHRVRLQHPRGRQVERRVHIAAGRTELVSVELE